MNRAAARWLVGTLLMAVFLIVCQSSCGDATNDCCECYFSGQDRVSGQPCSDHFGPQKFPNGITQNDCASFCSSQRTCPVSQALVYNGCAD